MPKYLSVDDLVTVGKAGLTLLWSRHSKATLGGGVIIEHSQVPQKELAALLRKALKLAAELDREETARKG